MKDSELVKNKIKRFLSYSGSSRAWLREFMTSYSEALPDSAIFGGMVRDFNLGLARTFCSDIDIVSKATRKDIFNVIKQYQPEINKYGGFRFKGKDWEVDVWALEDTWALRNGHVKGEDLVDLCSTTFFNSDAVIYHLETKQIRSTPMYDRCMATRVLDVNLRIHPAPATMAVRAVNMAIFKGFSVSSDLATFILDNATARNDVERRYLECIERDVRAGRQACGLSTQMNLWSEEIV